MIIYIILPLLLGIILYTIAGRKVQGFIQHRVSPAISSPYGLLQPVVDGVKSGFKLIYTSHKFSKENFWYYSFFILVFYIIIWAIFTLLDLNYGIFNKFYLILFLVIIKILIFFFKKNKCLLILKNIFLPCFFLLSLLQMSNNESSTFVNDLPSWVSYIKYIPLDQYEGILNALWLNFNFSFFVTLKIALGFSPEKTALIFILTNIMGLSSLYLVSPYYANKLLFNIIISSFVVLPYENMDFQNIYDIIRPTPYIRNIANEGVVPLLNDGLEEDVRPIRENNLIGNGNTIIRR